MVTKATIAAKFKQTEIGVIPSDWNVVTLGEIATRFVNGGTPSTNKPEYWTGNIPWITGADIVNQKITEVRRFITKDAVKNSSTNIVETDNLLIVTRTGVGKLAITPFDLAISQDLTGIYIRNDQVYLEYLFHYFDYNAQTLKNLNQGTSIAGITRETLFSTPILLPPFSEQEAIAAVLSDIDALIAELEQLITKKRLIKQGAMQQLLTGQQRLPGFTGTWEEKTFDECFTFLPTGSNSRSQLSEVGDVRYIHYGDIHTKWTTILDCDKAAIPLISGDLVKNLPHLQDGDLIIADASEDYEGVGKSIEIKNVRDRKVVAGLHTLLLRADKTVLADGFKAHLTSIKAVKESLIQIATGTSVYGIAKNKLKMVRILIPPTVEEQQAIAQILGDMDDEIEALQQQRDKYKALKQGLMQELLTGKTRLQ